MNRLQKLGIVAAATLALGGASAGIVAAQTDETATPTPTIENATPADATATPVTDDGAADATEEPSDDDATGKDGRDCPKHDAAEDTAEDESTTTSTTA